VHARDSGFDNLNGMGAAAAAALGGLLFVLPFEPRAPVATFLGLRVSLLEALAALAAAVLVAGGARRWRRLGPRVPWPLVFLALFAAAHLLSALLAGQERGAGVRFALRMGALAAFAGAVALAPRAARRAGLAGLAAAGGLVALLALGEAGGLRGLDPFLDLFREMRFTVGGTPRVTAGTAYPTLAAVWIGAGLLALAGRALTAAHPLPLTVAGALVATPALLDTYSRGAMAAAGGGLLVLAVAGARAFGARALWAMLAAVAVLAGGAAFQAARREVFRLRFTAENARQWYGAAYEPAERGLSLAPRERRRTEVRVVNTGKLPWPAGQGFALSYHWFQPGRSTLDDGGRTPLPAALDQGEVAVLRPEVVAPARPGCYLLVWDMVQEHTTWFSGQGVAPSSVPVSVGAPGADCGSVLQPKSPVAWQPTRAELWVLAARMWRDRPWTGVGPDNFRRLYGPYAGREFWDNRITANNLYLETAATTGLFGLLALGGALVSCALLLAGELRRALPAGRAEAAVLLALLAAFVLHGVVDYVLGFTGPYLLLAFIVGSACALRAEAASGEAGA
jgi:hypothetical protein